MTTVYPASEDSFDRPTASSSLSGHAALHDDLADAIEAIENKVGVDNSTDATSIDYKLAHLGDTYYTETEVDTALAAKLNSSAYTANDVLTKIKTVDGAGSGLDADLLDGNQASAFSLAHSHPYLSSTGKAADSDKLDGLDSTQFLRSDTANTATGLVTFDRSAGTDWTDATAVVRSSNEQCSLALRGGGDSTTYDKNTIQLRPANTGGGSPQPLLYMQNHDNSDQANIQVKSIYYSGSLYPVSSLTVKNTIQDYDGATAVIDSLRPVTFLYNASPDMGKQVGLIAEEVQAVDPMFVAETDVPSLNLNSIVGLAIAGLKEANTRIAELEAKVAELEAG